MPAPAGGDYAVYRNAPAHWHNTLFHTARLGDARPDALTPGGGICASLGGPTVSRLDSRAIGNDGISLEIPELAEVAEDLHASADWKLRGLFLSACALL